MFITGFEGFLGSNLALCLLELGADIIGLDIKIYRKKTILIPGDYKRITIIKGSVENYRLLDEIIKRHKVQVIFHLAAKALVGECLKEPLSAFSNNIKGTWNILECSRLASGVRAVIIASSDKAYGSNKKLPYREEARLSGRHPYDVSKSCADLLASSYYHTYKIPVGITRCGNIYGPGDFNLSRLIPGAIESVLKGRVFEIRSDGKYIRDYIYVEDVVCGYILLAQQLERKKLAGGAFNFSNEKPLSVMDVLKAIYRIVGRKPNYKILNTVKCEIKKQYLSAQKARSVLGWKPKYSLEAGLRKTIQVCRLQ